MIYSIVVTFNGHKWINKCLDSLLNSNVPCQVIVVDNNSTDGTLGIIRKKYPQVELIETQENLGFGKANNIGIKKAYDVGAEYVFLLNQDAWVNKDTLEKLVEASRKSPEYGIVSPIHLNGSGDKLDNNFSNYIAPQNCPDLYSDMWTSRLEYKIYKVNFVNAAGWLISRKTIETIGGFNPIFFNYCEDDNYIHRLRYHGLEVGIFPHSNIYHDRRDRPLSAYFTDSFELDLRRAILKYTNPKEESSIYSFIRKLCKEIVISIFMLQFSEARHSCKLLKAINQMMPEIEKTKTISKEIGINFLEKT